MEKSLQKQCAIFINCADSALVLQLSFTLRHRRIVSGKEIICNPSEARLDEYYDQLGSRFEVLEGRKKFLNEKCFVEKLKGLVLDRADPTGRYNETYRLQMSLDPRSKDCSISVTESLLIDTL